MNASARPKTSANLDMGGLATERTTAWMTRTVDTRACAEKALVAKMVNCPVVCCSSEVAVAIKLMLHCISVRKRAAQRNGNTHPRYAAYSPVVVHVVEMASARFTPACADSSLPLSLSPSLSSGMAA